MEYVQERVATLHDFEGRTPDAPLAETTVVVPLTGRDHASLAAEGVFDTLASLRVERVLVPLRADDSRVDSVVSWLESFDLPLSVLWCTAPRVESLLGEAGLDGDVGKGRDVWLGLGLASESEYVVVHDADATTYTDAHVPKLCHPLGQGYDFTKGYYARIEDEQLYGRLFRLFVRPLLRALESNHDAPMLSYLDAFRYTLAGEFAMTGDLARQVRAPRGWGLEIGTLGDAFQGAGFEGSAQVDLGIHQHEHRGVAGPGGLGSMAEEVAATMFHVLADEGIEPTFETLPDRYRVAANRLVEQYELDAGFNEYEYDAAAERSQVDTYAEAIVPPGTDDRLPTWTAAPIEPATVHRHSREALEARRGTER